MIGRTSIKGPGQFARAEGGNVVVTFALLTIPLFGMIGGAVDYGRWHSARSHTKTAMDAAVIAGTRTLIDSNGDVSAAVAAAQTYYTRNVQGRSPVLSDSISFQVNGTANGIVSQGNAAIETPILGVLGIHSLPLVDTSGADATEAMYTKGQGSNLEISLMLDVTGSMCDDGIGPCTSSTKLDALKAAANQLVDKVLGGGTAGQQAIRVAVVPFSTRVRVAPDGQAGIMKTLTDLDPTWSGYYKMCTQGSGSGGSESGGNWSCSQYQTNQYSNWKIMPCVTDRFYDTGWHFDLTDDAPGSNAWLNAHDGSRMTRSWDSSNAAATSQKGNSAGDPATHWNYSPDGICYDVNNANQVMPLSNDATTLKARINGLEAYGATAGVLGTAWSWYMLSPKWASVWSGTSAPGAYSLLTEQNENGAPKLRKIAILMTDGVYNTYRGWKDQDPAMVSQNAVQMCTNMKAQGIEVFTVGFSLSALSAAEGELATQTLQSCGSDVEHFYNTLNVEQLTAAFQEIANKVTNASIRLNK